MFGRIVRVSKVIQLCVHTAGKLNQFGAFPHAVFTTRKWNYNNSDCMSSTRQAAAVVSACQVDRERCNAAVSLGNTLNTTQYGKHRFSIKQLPRLTLIVFNGICFV